ncbi:YcgN family cysteine cluster protein [Rhodovulum tesquicola]|uniref:YcgN family cysteine cluster protein n=1 Tax=Rhodovulum tesquicola TaxID=540254 RepID=UPI002096FB61|nr:YcgN family cysteine cluster protein [Rhodovulum tesquicola]MCO8144071.1 YcgN family cysteine cluster protein [Rhodovulum tesquicola]
MSDPIDRIGLRPRFWEKVPMKKLTPHEWEALCDGCGKCCLNKLEDADTGEVVFTRIACRLLDGDTCRCGNYDCRKAIVPECVVLTPKNIAEIAYWMPASCAYRRVWEGKPLADWHPLVSGDAESVHRAGASVRGWTLPEFDIPLDEWEDHIIEEEL